MIDCHAHADFSRFPTADEIKAAQEQGVSHVCLIGSPAEIMAAANHFPDFVWPIVQADMNTWRPPEVNHWINVGARGIKFIAALAPYSAERYWPLYDVCQDRNVPAVFHTGYLGRYGPESLRARMTDARPAEFDFIARNWPRLRIVMAHFGNPWWDEAYKVLWANPNVYTDFSGGSAYLRDMDDWIKLLRPNGELSSAVNRIMFGTDKTYGGNALPRLDEYRVFYCRLLARLGVTADQCRMIYGDTAEVLFGRGR